MFAPSLSGQSDQSSDEGSSHSFSLGSFSDPGANDNPWDAYVNWGDGSPVDHLAFSSQGSLGSASHTYADNTTGGYTVTVKVTDRYGAAGSGSFQAAGQTLTTSFASPGNHLVRLRVTDASGASNVAAETIPVGSRALPLMQPFPLVRIVSTRTGRGIRLRLLSILASRGTRITITCKGRSCPIKKQSKVAAAGKVGLASVSFGRFQRTLASGTILEIRISRAGEIGKYTSLSIRRGALKRVDACLPPTGTRPMPCPSR